MAHMMRNVILYAMSEKTYYAVLKDDADPQMDTIGTFVASHEGQQFERLEAALDRRFKFNPLERIDQTQIEVRRAAGCLILEKGADGVLRILRD